MQRMQMRMKLPLKHDFSLCTAFCKEFKKASEVELIVKTVNDLQ